MDTLFTDATASTPGTPLVAAWHNDANSVVYNTLASVAGADTITAVGPLSMTAYLLGQRFFFIPASLNSGATTININGLGAKAILFAGVALEANMLVPGHVAEIYYDGTNFQLMNSQTFPLAQATGILPVANGGSGVAVAANAPWNAGRLLNVRSFLSGSGTLTPTTGTNLWVIEAIGGGGGGGGCPAAPASQGSAGGGGTSGTWGVIKTQSPVPVTYSVGSGGSGNFGAAGITGGNTTVGTIIFPGGSGATAAGPRAGAGASGGLGGAAAGISGLSGSSTKIAETIGLPGNPGFNFTGTNVMSGQGGHSPLGNGGYPRWAQTSASINGIDASGYGAGGGGAVGVETGSLPRGGNGSPGCIIVYEYA